MRRASAWSEVVNTSHPITAGLEFVEMVDETYSTHDEGRSEILITTITETCTPSPGAQRYRAAASPAFRRARCQRLYAGELGRCCGGHLVECGERDSRRQAARMTFLDSSHASTHADRT
jgi:hypothetical protein